MDNRPIGIFDSGIGGLTSIPYLLRQLPNERIIFYGDTARTPYGSKSVDTIRQFTLQIGNFMVQNNVKMMLVACNTISATSLDLLKETYPDIPIIGTISPTSRVIANKCNGMDRIGILATKATVDSGVYIDKIKEKNYQLKNIFAKACPALVPLIEEGIIDNEIMDLTLKYYLDDFIDENQIDTLVLACTHYPLIRSTIRKVMGDKVNLVNPAYETAIELKNLLERDNLANKCDVDSPSSMYRFYVSDAEEKFKLFANSILPFDITMTKQINIENY